MVLPGRRLDHRHPFLSGPPATEKARRKDDDGSGGRQRGLVHAAAAPRDGPCAEPRLPAGERARVAEALRPAFTRLFRELSRPPVQQALRAPPRRLVRPEPSRGGLRRNSGHMAYPWSGLEATVRRLEGAG